jgi:ubiquinone/menaquinone biosynthesis C-methylase UbiE
LIDRKQAINLRVEELSYYDYFGYLGVPFFHLGGLNSTRQLAQMCSIDEKTRVLSIGCGTGFSICYIAKRYNCEVVGIDISPRMIESAKLRIKKEGLEGKVRVFTADAHELPFEDNSFDVIIMEFAAVFLDTEKAFGEFARVVRPEGFTGINELFLESEIPDKSFKKILEAEDIFREITRLPFKIPTSDEWKESFFKAGFKEIRIEKHREIIGFSEFIEDMGGVGKTISVLLGISSKMLRHSFSSREIRRRFFKLSKAKGILLRKPSTSKYTGYILAVGKKPGQK